MSVDWRLFPSMASLRAFDATARCGDFAAAARALNVTHAAVAQQVRALEKHTGTALAIRDGRSVSLTPAGHELAQSFLEGFDTIAEGLLKLQERQTRRGIRVTATPFLVDRIITPNLTGFWDQNPGAEISIQPAREYIDIVKEGFDLAIRVIPHDADLTWPNLDIVPVATTRVVGIVAPELLEQAGGDPQSLPWLEHDGMTSKYMMMRDCGLKIERLALVPIGSPNLLLEAVRNGIGATLFSEQFTREDISARKLVEVPLPKKLYTRYLAATPKGPKHKLVDALVDWIRLQF